MTWMQRLRRVFDIDIGQCPRCGAPLRAGDRRHPRAHRHAGGSGTTDRVILTDTAAPHSVHGIVAAAGALAPPAGG
jgi:hypothetical protein